MPETGNASGGHQPVSGWPDAVVLLGRLLGRVGVRNGGRRPSRGPSKSAANLEWQHLRRRSARRYARRTALLADAGQNTLRCRIADSSAHGMRLLLPDPDCVVPATFSLVVVETGVIYRVRRVWRRKSQVGVEFLASEVLLTSRTEDLYFDFMRRVQSLPPSEVR